ncbi:hypothetical protein PPTG_22568 [Phytophthora nicotianae INRA-310]|uniref:Uncharacterized protein n=1 Tax=Phytophthora nicotianae (strain INRA-310) TaxID=761204 RepID=W2QG49_PHYN3|nr:hypothetical protein PPTG_22568 [Phytophthora nicotianae INRA-310]ETN11260.1 hypothetical protein PPTG_22568 [Phytophthora nicotianae INRA-310]
MRLWSSTCARTPTLINQKDRHHKGAWHTCTPAPHDRLDTSTRHQCTVPFIFVSTKLRNGSDRIGILRTSDFQSLPKSHVFCNRQLCTRREQQKRGIAVVDSVPMQATLDWTCLLHKMRHRLVEPLVTHACLVRQERRNIVFLTNKKEALAKPYCTPPRYVLQ